MWLGARRNNKTQKESDLMELKGPKFSIYKPELKISIAKKADT